MARHYTVCSRSTAVSCFWISSACKNYFLWTDNVWCMQKTLDDVVYYFVRCWFCGNL